MKGIPSQGHSNVLIAGMTSTCLDCGRVWDTNDADPPLCEPTENTKPIERDPPPQPKAYSCSLKVDPALERVAHEHIDSGRFVGKAPELGMGYGGGIAPIEAEDPYKAVAKEMYNHGTSDRGWPHAATNGQSHFDRRTTHRFPFVAALLALADRLEASHKMSLMDAPNRVDFANEIRDILLKGAR